MQSTPQLPEKNTAIPEIFTSLFQAIVNPETDSINRGYLIQGVNKIANRFGLSVFSCKIGEREVKVSFPLTEESVKNLQSDAVEKKKILQINALA